MTQEQFKAYSMVSIGNIIDSFSGLEAGIDVIISKYFGNHKTTDDLAISHRDKDKNHPDIQKVVQYSEIGVGTLNLF